MATGMTETEKKELAKEVREWRGSMTAAIAANCIGISRRTYEGIEQGRGFSYPDLLRLAMIKAKESA